MAQYFPLLLPCLNRSILSAHFHDADGNLSVHIVKKILGLSYIFFMVLAHFYDVDGDLSDHNVGKIFGLSKILTVIL